MQVCVTKSAEIGVALLHINDQGHAIERSVQRLDGQEQAEAELVWQTFHAQWENKPEETLFDLVKAANLPKDHTLRAMREELFDMSKVYQAERKALFPPAPEEGPQNE